MLEACSAGLRGARCVRAPGADAVQPHAIAMVSWRGSSGVSIEVGLGRQSPPVWRTRELSFEAADPELERWRAVGFTIALLVGDEAWQPVPVDRESAPQSNGTLPLALEARAFTGAGLVSSAWRFGAEMRLSLLLSESFFATGSVQYALASEEPGIDLRWLDASVGVGIWSKDLFENVEGRARLELMLENLAVAAQREAERDRQNVWIPGLLVGADLGYRIAAHWVLSARVDAFGLDGSTAVTLAGDRVASSAGAGMFLGAGAGYRF